MAGRYHVVRGQDGSWVLRCNRTSLHCYDTEEEARAEADRLTAVDREGERVTFRCCSWFSLDYSEDLVNDAGQKYRRTIGGCKEQARGRFSGTICGRRGEHGYDVFPDEEHRLPWMVYVNDLWLTGGAPARAEPALERHAPDAIREEV